MSTHRLLELHDLAKQDGRRYERRRLLFRELLRDRGRHFTGIVGARPRPRRSLGSMPDEAIRDSPGPNREGRRCDRTAPPSSFRVAFCLDLFRLFHNTVIRLS
jgi:hypothetical protein